MAEVLERSPAESAGIMAGDVLIAYVAVAFECCRVVMTQCRFPAFFFLLDCCSVMEPFCHSRERDALAQL